VIHSDLALRQFFVDDELNIRLGDFSASQYPENPALGYEKATHCLPRDYAQPNTVLSDLFALGSTLFELVTGKAPYAELYPAEFQDIAPSDIQILTRAQQRRAADAEVEKRFRNLQFPDVSHIFFGVMLFWVVGAGDFLRRRRYSGQAQITFAKVTDTEHSTHRLLGFRYVQRWLHFF
jgi:hypothetical protein